MRKPPVCPNCAKPLYIVYENVYETYVFDKKTGTYIEKEQRGKLEVKCQNCKEDISNMFPDGVCNYQAKGKR